MRPVVAPLVALLVLATVAGCGGEDEAPADFSTLEGTPWVLASGLDEEGWETVAPSATFDRGRVAGSTGCNRFNGPYTVDGDAPELGQLAMTGMACLPPADGAEREYTAALERVAAWRSEDEELVLLDADDEEVLRYRAATPVGTWQANAILQGDAVVSLLSGTEISATFDQDGRLSGFAGCNNYTATYTTDRSAIEIAQPAATKKACAKPAGVMEQEAAYFAALPKAARFEVGGGTLELLTAKGTIVATFSRATQ
jgi:heat shock protein HslJ